MMGNEKKKSHTWIAFLIYIALLLVVMGIFLHHVDRVLVLYEAAQPENAIAAVAESLSVNGIGSSTTAKLADISGDAPGAMLPYTVTITDDTAYSAYENAADYLTQLNAEIAQNGVQYHREMEDFSTGAIRYGLYTGTHHFAETSLLPGESESRLKLLTITQWIPQEIRLLREAPKYSVSATLPEGYTMQVNGVEIDADCMQGRTELPGLDYCRNYVEIADLISYSVDGLYELPEVEIRDPEGELTAKYPSEDPAFALKDTCLDVTIQPAESEMPEDLRRFVLDSVETYSLFFSRDLPGATGSTAPIRHLFPEDSEYLSLAEEYRRNSMGYFDSHSKTHFVTEEADRYIAYGEDCFSCHVYLEKSMTIYGSREVIDKTDGIYYFVKINGSWVIADIR